jgi:hypothetical protein
MVWTIIILFILLIIIVITTVESVATKEKLKSTEAKLEITKMINKSLDMARDTYLKEINKRSAEYTVNELIMTNQESVIDKLKHKISVLENIDEYLKKDIQSYIESKYTRIPTLMAKMISNNIVDISSNENISPILITGIIEVESSFNPFATSKKQAMGLMQVMPEWVKKLDVVNKQLELYDIKTNIATGIKVLKIHIDEEKGDVTKGLYKYVGKDNTYADKVYTAMGKFVTFRSIISTKIKNERTNKNNDSTNSGTGTVSKSTTD